MKAISKSTRTSNKSKTATTIASLATPKSRTKSRAVAAAPTPSSQPTAATFEAPLSWGPTAGFGPSPSVDAPSPPAGFLPAKPGTVRIQAPPHAALKLAPSIVTQINGCANYAALFGKTAPPAADIASAVSNANGWSASLAAATAWREYVKEGTVYAWQQARPLLASLEGPFTAAVTLDPSVKATLPSLAAYYAVAAKQAQKGAATRKARAAAKKAVSASSPPPGTATPPAPANNTTPGPAVVVMAAKAGS